MKIRRVVTGHNREGKSIVQQDGEIETIPGRPGFSQVPVWSTKDLPAKLTDENPDSWKLGTTIAGGSVFRVIQYAPGVAERWHRTDSIDYAVILSGEIDMQMDEGEVHLKAGDFVVQRRTTHNWVNRGTEPCVIAFVVIATEGGQSTGW
jgi:mannose-6-phosphate isomerase-like protein (cupin superfamily)